MRVAHAWCTERWGGQRCDTDPQLSPARTSYTLLFALLCCILPIRPFFDLNGHSYMYLLCYRKTCFSVKADHIALERCAGSAVDKVILRMVNLIAHPVTTCTRRVYIAKE